MLSKYLSLLFTWGLTIIGSLSTSLKMSLKRRVTKWASCSQRGIIWKHEPSLWASFNYNWGYICTISCPWMYVPWMASQIQSERGPFLFWKTWRVAQVFILLVFSLLYSHLCTRFLFTIFLITLISVTQGLCCRPWMKHCHKERKRNQTSV